MMMDVFRREPATRRLFYFMSVIIALVSVAWLWQFVHDYDDPSGANGYFYMKQTESLASGVGFYFKDRSLAFSVPVALMKLLDDSLEAFRDSIILVWFSLTLSVSALLWNLSRHLSPGKRLGLVIAGLIAFTCCTQVYELALTFFKNAFALTLLTAGLACWVGPWETRRRTVVTSLLLGAAFFSHKSMLVAISAFLLPWALQKLTRRQLVYFGAAVGVAFAAFLVHFERAWLVLMHLKVFFSDGHAWRMWLNDLPVNYQEMALTLAVCAFTLPLAVLVRRRVPVEQRFFFDGTAILLVIAMNPFQMPGAEGPAYRLLLLLPALVIPACLIAIAERPRLALTLPLVIGAFAVQPFLTTHPLDQVYTPWADLREDVAHIAEYVDPEDHLTSHHGLEFFVDYVTGIRSRSFLSDHPEQRDYRVAWVSRGWLPNPRVQEALRSEALLEIGPEYILLPEAVWQKLREKYKIPKNWHNPDRHRPDFIYE